MPLSVYVIFALCALVVFGAGILVGVLAASLRAQQPPLAARTQTPAPPGLQCWVYDDAGGLRSGTIEEYQKQLAELEPDDARRRWLKNLNFMVMYSSGGMGVEQFERRVSGIQATRAGERS